VVEVRVGHVNQSHLTWNHIQHNFHSQGSCFGINGNLLNLPALGKKETEIRTAVTGFP
jgi:hypothetical protein